MAAGEISHQTSALPLLRLLLLADSGFPSGGFAYSHGLEWLASRERLAEADLAEIVAAYIEQAGAGQWLAAASLAHGAPSSAKLLRIDARLDASMAAQTERDAGRAMGERLLVGAAEIVEGPMSAALRAALARHATPGQYAVAFGAIARDAGVPRDAALAALGSGMAISIAQAAVRLGLIGQSAALRLVAGAAPRIDRAVRRAATARAPRFGAVTPGLELAAMLHPSLGFRMFAS